MLALTLILFVQLYPILRGLTILWTKVITKIYTNHSQRRQQQHKTLPKMHIIAFAADANEGDSAYSWDTDGIPFIIDNSATAIISNEQKLFTGQLTPMQITLETAEGKSVSTKLVGVISLVLTDDSNKHHTYKIPDCVYDPQIPINILGVPCLGKVFKDGADIRNLLDEDGTTVKSGSTKSHFVWDHGKNE